MKLFSAVAEDTRRSEILRTVARHCRPSEEKRRVTFLGTSSGFKTFCNTSLDLKASCSTCYDLDMPSPWICRGKTDRNCRAKNWQCNETICQRISNATLGVCSAAVASRSASIASAVACQAVLNHSLAVHHILTVIIKACVIGKLPFAS